MINYPFKRSDVASTTWELKSKFLNHDKLEAVPEHMKINKLNNGPFDLTSVALQADVLNQSSNQKTKWDFKNSLDTLNLDTNDTNKGKEKTKVHSFITANNSSPADLNKDIIQEKNFIEDSDIWTLYNNEAQKSAYILGYRSWDKKNEIDCPIFLTDSTKYSDIIFKKNPSNAGIIEHERLIKDIIYLLVGSPSLCFRWCQSKFVLRQPAIQLRYITPTAIQT
ncbi:hypothetical protein BJ944DRAFT_266578 [Cunninghamella echinulata]|nr:hypothetical protein BJ944DRAFT_266578 [Cunninghamella echinulata]